MVIRFPGTSQKNRGALTTELIVAMALLAAAVLPIAYSFASEKRYARAAYQHAVAMELVDGETEILRAGTWRRFHRGVQDYSISAGAAVNLPPGRFLLTLRTNAFTLEWRPDTKKQGVAPVSREVNLP
jgi:hypothetical protein